MKHNFSGGGYSGKISRNIILTILSIILAVMLILLMWQESVISNKKSQELKELSKQLSQESQNVSEQMEQKSFYQKLADGTNVNILVVGDSIGVGTGASSDETFWGTQLKSYIQNTYGNSIHFTNVSMGGNTSYAGYVRTMTLEDNMDYDLAVICYGQNDAEDELAVNYEAVIRALENKYSDCSIISILESSQREYTQKMMTIQSICEYYGIPVADTIGAFNDSGQNYNDLTDDGVHPNDKGQDIYFNTVKEIIDTNVLALTDKMEKKDPVNADVDNFDNFVWYGSAKDFTRVDDTTFMIETSADGILGIDYTYESGDNKADIYIDGKLYESPTVTFNYDFSQRHIAIVNNNCTVKNEIKIVFKSKEQADGFKGICFSWK